MAVFPLASLGIKAIQANADITVSMVNTAGATVTAVYPANVPISFGDLASQFKSFVLMTSLRWHNELL